MVCWDGVGNKVVDFSGDYFVFLEKTEKFVVMMKRKIILVTGGQRSGKSRYAQELALKLAENPVYLATSRVWDDEFRERVRRHQQDRGPQWTNLEEEKAISRCDVSGRVVVIDCVTLWCKGLGNLEKRSRLKSFFRSKILLFSNCNPAFQRKGKRKLNRYIADLADIFYIDEAYE